MTNDALATGEQAPIADIRDDYANMRDEFYGFKDGAEDFDAALADHDRKVAAKAWDEGATRAWCMSGEGWNGEYPDAQIDQARALRAVESENPYRADELQRSGNDDYPHAPDVGADELEAGE